jgi:hypothetical protein
MPVNRASLSQGGIDGTTNEEATAVLIETSDTGTGPKQSNVSGVSWS